MRIKLKRETAERLVGNSRLEKMNIEIKAIRGFKLLGLFKVEDAIEFVSYFLALTAVGIAVALLGTYNGGSIRNIVLIPLILTFGIYGQYKRKVDEYKEQILLESELPSTVETLSIGVEAGLTPDYIIRYIIKNKRGLVRDLLNEAIIMIDSGDSFKNSFERIEQKSLSKEFMQMVRIITDNYSSGTKQREMLVELREDIEEMIINNKLKSVQNIDTKLFPIIFFGFLIPILVGIAYPILSKLTGFGY